MFHVPAHKQVSVAAAPAQIQIAANAAFAMTVADAEQILADFGITHLSDSGVASRVADANYWANDKHLAISLFRQDIKQDMLEACADCDPADRPLSHWGDDSLVRVGLMGSDHCSEVFCGQAKAERAYRGI